MRHIGTAVIARNVMLATVGIGVLLALVFVAGVLAAPGAQTSQGARTTPGADTPLANPPAFEVASVKANKSADNRVMLGFQPGGRFSGTNVSLSMLIRTAYRLQNFQIVGGPSWMFSDRFDVVAKADADPTADDRLLMMRALLAERFKLSMHNETRELPIYTMVVARSDGKLGPRLKPTATDCAALRARGRGGAPPAPSAPGGSIPCGMRMAPGSITAGSMTLAQLAQTLSQSIGRVIVDKTGLSGQFDFELTWRPEQIAQGAPRDVNAPPLPDGDPNTPSIFTALQEQLGLKLEGARGPVDVMVVDRVEPPTPD